MSVEIIYFIVVITIVSGVILETDSISVSNDKVSWEEATGSGHTLLSSDYVLSHGWDSIPKYLSASRYWIGARANYTPFVSWEGCVQWTGDFECGYLHPGGSIGECFQNCGENKHYLLLNGSHCRCVPWKNDSCFQYTQSRCNRHCPKNPNDWCGGSDDVMSLYNTGPYNYTITETNNGTERNCVVLIDRDRTHTIASIQYQSEYCRNSFIRRYICKNNSSSFVEDNIVHLGWVEAHEQCREKGRGLHYNVSSKKLNGRAFWTSLRRSILLKWTKKKDDDFPFCVSLSVDNSNVNLHEEPCDRHHHYLYWHENKEGYARWRWWYPLLVLPIAGVLVIVVLYRVVLSRKRSKESKPQEGTVQDRPTVASDHANNTVEEESNASAPRHMYHLLEIVDSAGKTVSGHGARNNIEMSIYDTTLDSRYRGGVLRLISDPGSVYNTTFSRGAVGIVQSSNNIYNTTLCRGFVRSMPRDYVSCNVYGSVRNVDTDVYDNADTSPEIAVADDTDSYDDMKS